MEQDIPKIEVYSLLGGILRDIVVVEKCICDCGYG